MKIFLHLTLFTLLGSGLAFGQNLAPFSSEIEPTPKEGSEQIKLDCRIFNGDYATPTDYLDVLAISKDCTVYDPDARRFAPLKGNISAVYAVRESGVGSSSDSNATVFATIDHNQKDAVLGDGGGVIFFKINRDKTTGAWKVVRNGLSPGLGGRPIFYRNVSFKNVDGGATFGNNSIRFVTTHKNTDHTVFVTEGGSEIQKNADLIGFSDTSDYTFPNRVTFPTIERSVIRERTTVKKYQTVGWPIQLNAQTGEVVGKTHRLGRGVSAISQGQLGTIYVLGGNPSVLVKYAPLEGLDDLLNFDYPPTDPLQKKKGDVLPYLYAYKQNEDGTGGFTVPFAYSSKQVLSLDASGNLITVDSIWQNLDSLILAKESALKRGATIFANVGDLTESRDNEGNAILVLTEKGIDDSGDLYNNRAKIFNGKLAKHLIDLDAKDGTEDGRFNDPYGRVLAITNLDAGGALSTILEGGTTKDNGKYFFSNPDKLETAYPENTQLGPSSPNVFIIKENIPSVAAGRNPSGTAEIDKTNEAYFVEIGDSYGVFPKDYSDPNSAIKSLPFSNFKLYASSSRGASFASNGGDLSSVGGTFLTNGAKLNDTKYDTYLTVVKGIQGSDRSIIVAVRNIYPDPTISCLVENPLGFSDYNSTKNTMVLWPNPSKGTLNAQMVDNFVVIDLQGVEWASFQQTKLLDLSQLKKGVYFVKNTQGSVKKIVLE